MAASPRARHAAAHGWLLPRARSGFLALVLPWLALSSGEALARPAPPLGPRPAQTASLAAPPSRDVAGGRIDAASGALRTRFMLRYAPRPGTPESMAREYLRLAAPELGIGGDLEGLDLVRIQSGQGTRHVRFRQTWRGVPVFASDVVVSLRQDGSVAALASDWKPGVSLSTAVPALPARDAEAIALARLAAGDAVAPIPRSELVIWSREGRHRLAWRVAVVLLAPLGDWEVFVDAGSGEVFSLRDRMCYAHGQGLVFHPDPISTAAAPYGSVGLVDGGDANTAPLANQRVWIPLYDITQTPGPGSQYQLSGPACVIQDFPGAAGAPFGDDVTAYQQNASDGFNHGRDEQAFEAVMVYGHLTNLQYWLQLIGFTNVNNDQDPVDPHGVGGADNSFYSETWDALAFGEGGVDDAEDAGVIAHEYGHAIQHDQVPGWGQFHEGMAMGEGFGDYLAGSYVGALSAYQSNWVFKWDGPIVTGDPGLRPLDSPKVYPTGLTFEAHDDGEIWSACLWAIHGALGRVLTDQLVIQSHFYLTPGATFRDGALAILQADQDITGGANQVAIQGAFTARGILGPNPFVVAALAGSDQARPAIAFDRDPGNYPHGWGRHLLVAWQDDRNGTPLETFARRVHASGTLRAPELNLGVFADPEIAFAPRQDWPDTLGANFSEPEFLVVGAKANATSDIVGRLVRSSSAAVIPLPAIAADPTLDEVRPAADAVEETYMVGYLADNGMGATWVQVQRLDENGGLLGAALPLVSPPIQMSVDVGAGNDPVSGLGQFLVVWGMFDFSIPEYRIESIRVDRDGLVLDPAPTTIAFADPTTEASLFNPAVAFDGTAYLVVWDRQDATTGNGEIHGRYVSAFDGTTSGGPFLIGAAATGREPDVAFDGRQYCVVWDTHPLPPTDADVLAVRIDPLAGVLDPAPIPIAASGLREHLPRVTAVSGREPATAGRGFCVVWSQDTVVPPDEDVLAKFVPDTMPPLSPPVPLALGVTAGGFGDDEAAPGDTADLVFTVKNTGTRKDGYRLQAVGTEVTWTHIVQPLIVLDPGAMTDVLVRVAIPSGAAAPDTDFVLLTATSATHAAVTDTVVGMARASGTTGAGPPPAVAFALQSPVPTPFSSEARIAFGLPREAEVRLEVFDVAGQRVRTLASGRHPAGPHRVTWSGDDRRGRRLPTGVYLVRLTAGPWSAVRRALIVR